ncbi:MAG: helix-turn-helix domain-containing protein [Victivallales bacterium]
MDIFKDIHTLDTLLGYNPRPVIHCHENHHEFFFCAEGRGTQHLQSRIIKMDPGDFFLFPAGQLHIGNGTEKVKCRGYVLNIKDSTLLKFVENDLEFGIIFKILKENALRGMIRINLSPEGTAKTKLIFEEIIEENRIRRIGYQLAIRACIEELAVTLLRNSKVKLETKQKLKASPEDKINEFCRFLETNFMYDINVEQAAKMTNFSRSHFHDVFASQKGTTLVKYLNAVRIRKAIGMLKDSDLSFDQTGSACGFKSLSHFYLVFRKETGKKPGDFRK